MSDVIEGKNPMGEPANIPFNRLKKAELIFPCADCGLTLNVLIEPVWFGIRGFNVTVTHDEERTVVERRILTAEGRIEFKERTNERS